MLTDADFNWWAMHSNLSDAHRKAINEIRHGEFRKVKAPSCIGRTPSTKGRNGSLQFESRTCEFSAVTIYEFDPDVIEIWDQPATKIDLRISFKKANGRNGAVLHHPDYLVLRKRGAAFVECKPRAKLVESAHTTPGRFKFIDGKWQCPSGAEQAKQLYGIGYEIFVPDLIPSQFITNLQLILAHG